MTIVNLPYDKPPLTANKKMHWAEEAKRRRKIRGDMAWLMKSTRNHIDPLTPGQKLRVQLIYTPATHRRRDTDNLWPTLKPLCDGLVDAGIVPDDTPEYMVKPEPIIEPVAKRHRNRLRLELTIIEGEDNE